MRAALSRQCGSPERAASSHWDAAPFGKRVRGRGAASRVALRADALSTVGMAVRLRRATIIERDGQGVVSSAPCVCFEKGAPMKALIPAAGLGTRFLPATKAQPKEMLLVVDRPAIQYVVEEGLASAADEVVIINSREKKAIEEHFSPNPQLVATLRARGKDKYADLVEQVGSYNVSYVYQDEALGLGHAVRCAAEKTGDEPFYVLLGDVLVPDNTMLPRMQEVSDAHGGASVIAVMPVPDDQVSRFGVIAGAAVEGADDVWKVDALVEKPALEDAPSNGVRTLSAVAARDGASSRRAARRGRRDPADGRARCGAARGGDVRARDRSGRRLRHRHGGELARDEQRAVRQEERRAINERVLHAKRVRLRV